MSSLVETDDSARRLKDVWKGNDTFSIPFDARYGAWAAGGGLSLVATPLMWNITGGFRDGGLAGAALLAVTVLILASGAAYTLRAKLAQQDDKTRARFKLAWLAPYGLAPWFLAQFWGAATTGGPAGTLFSLLAAVTLGVGGSVLLVRSVGKQINAVTPLRYQVAVLRAEASAPRQPKPTTRLVVPPAVLADQGVVTRPVTAPTVVA